MKIKIPFFRRLSTRLVLAITASFLFVIVTSFLFLYFRVAETLREKTDSANIQSFRQLEYNIDRFAGEVDMLSRQMIGNQAVSELVSPLALSQREKTTLTVSVFRQMEQILTDYAYVESVVFISSADFALVATQSQNIVQEGGALRGNFYETVYSRAQQEMGSTLRWLGGYTNHDFSIRELPSNRSLGDNPVHYLSAYRQVYQGRHRGLVVLNVDVDYFTSIYNHASAGELMNRSTYIVDSANAIISHPDHNRLGLLREAPAMPRRCPIRAASPILMPRMISKSSVIHCIWRIGQ